MRPQGEESTAAESARRATGAAAERDRRGRFSARRTRATVLRLLRGEDLEAVSRELGPAARASHWRDQFLAAGQAGLKRRAPDARDAEHPRRHAKVGERRQPPLQRRRQSRHRRAPAAERRRPGHSCRCRGCRVWSAAAFQPRGAGGRSSDGQPPQPPSSGRMMCRVSPAGHRPGAGRGRGRLPAGNRPSAGRPVAPGATGSARPPRVPRGPRRCSARPSARFSTPRRASRRWWTRRAR